MNVNPFHRAIEAAEIRDDLIGRVPKRHLLSEEGDKLELLHLLSVGYEGPFWNPGDSLLVLSDSG